MDFAEVLFFPVLKDNVAIVTGSAQGMGEATASVFLCAGAKEHGFHVLVLGHPSP